MGTSFWIRRFCFVLCLAFGVIAAGQLLRRHTMSEAFMHATLWAPIAASVFTVARLYQSSRGQRCDICRDTPE